VARTEGADAAGAFRQAGRRSAEAFALRRNGTRYGRHNGPAELVGARLHRGDRIVHQQEDERRAGRSSSWHGYWLVRVK
jgi:hypothetical protein